ncbi:MAG: ABC transporter permease subunit [Planctomycetota bacterium]|nr:MAG: ABC transporter permease subunit [Planctomycetota bacterium]
MWQYLVKRLLLLVVTLFGISVISFLIVTMAPGDPAALKASAMGKGRSSGISEFTTRKNRELFFLDRPVLINFSPADRASSVAKALRELDAPLELERKDARSRLVNDIGTAALAGIFAALPKRLETAQREVEARQRALAALDGATGDALRQALNALAEAYPAFEPRLPLVDGKAPPPERFADVWRRQRKTLLEEAEAPVRRLLDVLAAIVPRGGPQLPKDGDLAASVQAWLAWWEEHRADYTPEAAERAARAWLALSGKSEGTPERAALERVGQLAAPTLMDALLDADPGSDAERRAAAGLALVCKKPWSLELTASELEQLRNEWRNKKAAIEEEAKKAPESVTRKALAALGSEEDYLARERERELERRRRAWRTWWYRAAEYTSDFTALQQLGRAFSQTQFGRWMSRLVVFDFGESYKHKRPVSELIWERFKITFALNVPSILLIYLCAIPIGIFSATHQRSTGDRVATLVLFVLYSIPSFWAGSMLIMFFTGAPFLDWFPAYHIASLDNHTFTPWEKVVDYVHHGTLPVLCLTYGGLAYVAKQMRSSMLEVIRQDYIRTAKAKGLPRKKVIYKHALRNALIPILTLMASLLPVLFGGSVIIESIFSIEGLGKLAFEAIFDRDYPVIMANLVISGFLTLLGILLTDIAYAIVDPRIEYR